METGNQKFEARNKNSDASSKKNKFLKFPNFGTGFFSQKLNARNPETRR